MDTVEYKVYSIKYQKINDKGKKETVCEEFYLRIEERDDIYNNGSSKVHLYNNPAAMKHLFYSWNLPSRLIKTKHTYLCIEPSEERKQTETLTEKDYIIKKI